MLYEIGRVGKGWRLPRDRALPMVLETELQKSLPECQMRHWHQWPTVGCLGLWLKLGLLMVGS